MESIDILNHISNHFNAFDDYIKLHSIQLIENDEIQDSIKNMGGGEEEWDRNIVNNILITFDFITMDNINDDLDIDEEHYFYTLEIIERHFKLCSFNILDTFKIKKISFISTYKEFHFEKESEKESENYSFLQIFKNSK